jgi:hypothetical protein
MSEINGDNISSRTDVSVVDDVVVVMADNPSWRNVADGTLHARPACRHAWPDRENSIPVLPAAWILETIPMFAMTACRPDVRNIPLMRAMIYGMLTCEVCTFQQHKARDVISGSMGAVRI